MTKKQARGRVNEIAAALKQLTDINPDCLNSMTIYIHRIPEDRVPEGFVVKPPQYGKHTRQHSKLRSEEIDLTVFTIPNG